MRHIVFFIIVSALGFLLLTGTAARAALSPDQVPTFRLRAKVTSVGGQDPAGKQFSFRLGTAPVNAKGGEWSDWMKFDRPQIEANLKGYPAIYMSGFPVVTSLNVGGVVDPTIVEAEAKVDENGAVMPLRGELFGPALGILIWRDENKQPQVATMATYNNRYWKPLEGVQIPQNMRPRKFPIVDRFIGADSDRIEWREGIENLNRIGFNALMMPGSKELRDVLLKAGLHRTAAATYNPPGYAFDYDPKVTPDAIKKWADEQAKPFTDAGYAKEDMATFAMSDEPGWYFPSQFKPLLDNPVSLARFRDYLKSQKLQPADVGAKSWDTVLPIGRSQANDLPSKRLFYWSMRFFSWDSSRHFAVSTRALESAFYPNMPIFTNLNFFSGRFYVPGPVANNGDKQNPDAAMGGHDWLEFGRMRGSTMMWTEDWFGDDQSYQWSFYAARMRSAAEKSGINFGGYVIPRTAGDRDGGIIQKILCLVGSGAKAVQYFVFGPEYNFPGNCYSENTKVLPQMAEAHRMIGAAEDVLWPGKLPHPQVAILQPRSSEVWDAKDIPIPNQIQDATNNNLNSDTVDYMAEVFDIYVALQHSNIPANFVEEDDLSPQGLKNYKVLYVTEPNIPTENMRGLIQWVRSGGTLVTVTGAAMYDRYNEASTVLSQATGIVEKPRDRLLMSNLNSLQTVGRGQVAIKGSENVVNGFEAVGARGAAVKSSGTVMATFDDGSQAIMSSNLGRGRVLHFAWFPGLWYVKSSKETKGGLPVGFSQSIRHWITYPEQKLMTATMVNEMVEAPMLESANGAAITLLNWSGEPIQTVNLTARPSFTVQSAESVKRGPLTFQKTKGGITLSLPLDAVDIVILRPAK